MTQEKLEAKVQTIIAEMINNKQSVAETLTDAIQEILKEERRCWEKRVFAWISRTLEETR